MRCYDLENELLLVLTHGLVYYLFQQYWQTKTVNGYKNKHLPCENRTCLPMAHKKKVV